MDEMEWIKVSDREPERGVLVQTRRDGVPGTRVLKRHERFMVWVDELGRVVFYPPTEWRPEPPVTDS